jgi:NAD+ diphosphatase
MDHYQRSARNAFSACIIDRQTERRGDLAGISALADGETSRFLLLHQRRCLLHTANNALLLLQQPPTDSPPCYLGLKQGQPLFAVQLGDTAEAEGCAAALAGRWVDLRTAAGCLADNDAGIVAYAIAMFNWQQRHQYCGSCGSPNHALDGGHRMRCSHVSCGQMTFPRIDPAMITLIEHDDAILLGRQEKWPRRRYSTLAGFVEPGESIEDAVRREVMEEAGVSLNSIHYHSSQPWPFPGSLMLGFRTTAETRKIQIGAELADARWWTLREFEHSVRSQELLLSIPQSIAFALISDWYAEHTGTALIDILPAAD